MENINGNIDDFFYRYKMPKLKVKIEGRGNGIKTIIDNIEEISKSLNRPSIYIIKYFGIELGTNIQYILKNNCYKINGYHKSTDLKKLLYLFINKFVLCTECNNPETVFNIKNKTLFQSCKACGKNIKKSIDHKLISFIINYELKKSDELEKNTINDRLDKFWKFLETQETLNPTNIVNETKKLNIKNKSVLILIHFLLDNNCSNIQQIINLNRNLLLTFTFNNKKAQRYLLGGIEQLVCSNKILLLPKINGILKLFYDNDLIEESEIINWATKESDKFITKKDNKEIRLASKPFLQWLKEADEETE
jgi:translation initiation factor 2 beta subunit (eIF-2beta)/eIF-5